MGTALLIIDIQNDFFKEDPLKQQKGQLVKKTNELITLARQNNVPIIWIRNEWELDLSNANLHAKKIKRMITIRGTKGSEIVSELHREEKEKVLTKTRYSAFFDTNLETFLNQLGIYTVILAGVHTHACVRTTAIDAYQRDLQVVIAKECVASYNEEHARITLAYLRDNLSIPVVNNQEIFK